MTIETLTDNDHVMSKVGLRVDAVSLLGEPRPIRVLDAFHGHGRLWQLVLEQLDPAWKVTIFGVDKELRAAGTLKVDNTRLLEALDLSRFDLIDLDAYGWPTAQLRIVAAKAPDKLVVTTRISRALGPVPKVVLNDLNLRFPPDAPQTLINRAIADELWEAWLFHLGYEYERLVRYDGPMAKRYGCVIPKGFVLPEGRVL